MKYISKISIYFFSVVLLSTLFSSCTKKDAQNVINTYINSMSATVNGSAFTSANTNGAVNQAGTGYQLTIDGTASNGQRITVAVNNFTGSTGTFNIGNGGTGIGAFNTGVSGSADLIASSGQVVITAIDRTNYNGFQRIDGTFSFVTSGTTVYTVTAGTFTVYVK